LLKERFSRHFFVVHTFVSKEARREYLTRPEKREPPEPRQKLIKTNNKEY